MYWPLCQGTLLSTLVNEQHSVSLSGRFVALFCFSLALYVDYLLSDYSGRYGSEEGLKSPLCSGACGHAADCGVGYVCFIVSCYFSDTFILLSRSTIATPLVRAT